MSNQDRISPDKIKQTSDENREKYKLGDYKLIQYQILQTNITRTVWQTVKRIINEILGVNPFTPTSDQDRISPYNINTISSR